MSPLPLAFAVACHLQPALPALIIASQQSLRVLGNMPKIGVSAFNTLMLTRQVWDYVARAER